MTADVVRFQRSTVTPDTGETLHFLWVVGENGAASTVFLPDARAHLGHTLATFPAIHSPRPLPDFEEHGACEFLETDCWAWYGSSIGMEPLVAAYDADDYGTVWSWLEGYYDGLLFTLALGADAELE